MTGKQAVHLGYIYDELLFALKSSELDESKPNSNIIYNGVMLILESTSDGTHKPSVDVDTFVWHSQEFVFQFGRVEVIRLSRYIRYLIEECDQTPDIVDISLSFWPLDNGMPDSRFTPTFISKSKRPNKNKNKNKTWVDARGRLYSSSINPTLSIRNLGGRDYSTYTKPLNSSPTQPIVRSQNVTPRFISFLLNTLNDPNNTFTNSETSQRLIENIIFDEYESLFSGNTNTFMTGGIKPEILGPRLKNYLDSKRATLHRYINNIIDIQKDILVDSKMSKRLDAILMAKIIISLDLSELHNLCLSQFLLVYTYQDSEEVKQFASVPVSVKLGKRMFSIYINNLKNQYVKDTKEHITYTLWLEMWKENNPQLYSQLDDGLHAQLGCKILDILMHSELLDQVLIKTADKEEK